MTHDAHEDSHRGNRLTRRHFITRIGIGAVGLASGIAVSLRPTIAAAAEPVDSEGNAVDLTLNAASSDHTDETPAGVSHDVEE